MTSFAELGVRATRRVHTSSVSLSTGAHLVGGHGGVEVASTTATTVEVTLPRPSAIAASFAKEGVGQKLIKLFKKELQTGDREFDDEVYISTDTSDATAAWLADEAVRADILELVAIGSTVEVDHVTVRVVLPGRDDEADDPTVVRLVQSLLARG